MLQSDPNVKVTATCIRVPVMRAHAESVNLQFENPLDEVMFSTLTDLNLIFFKIMHNYRFYCQ